MNFAAELREGLLISWSAIRANKMRSSLTTLGIIIGIVTVTLMGTAIQGLNQAFLKSISYIGADVLYVERFNWINSSADDWIRNQRRRQITITQCRALEKQMTTALAVAPVADVNQRIQYEHRRSDSVDIIGSTDQMQTTGSLNVSDGRFLSAAEVEGGRPVCVLGYKVATNLFFQESPVGHRITIGPRRFEVVGVLERLGSSVDGDSRDNQAIIPLRQLIAAFWSNPDCQIQVKARTLQGLEDTKEELRGVLRKIRRLTPKEPDDFAINQQEQFIQMFHRVAGTIALVGIFITGLSLFVGGIGIMNIMFVSVAERTREIGIRKAIGARRRTILVQFLIEAASICLIGGLLGLSIAWPLVFLLRKAMPAEMSPLVVALALGMSALTGILAGFFPAWRAARMDPVQALRQET